MNNKKKPFLYRCRLGFHKPYHYLPKVGGIIGEISIACKRCGYGYRYFFSTWDKPPSEVQEQIKLQAEMEFGRVIMLLRELDNPREKMQLAFNIIAEKFTEEELKPIREKHRDMLKGIDKG